VHSCLDCIPEVNGWSSDADFRSCIPDPRRILARMTNSAAVTRLNAVLEGCYEIERELGDGARATGLARKRA
jgi:hypothetical protein